LSILKVVFNLKQATVLSLDVLLYRNPISLEFTNFVLFRLYLDYFQWFFSSWH